MSFIALRLACYQRTSRYSQLFCAVTLTSMLKGRDTPKDILPGHNICAPDVVTSYRRSLSTLDSIDNEDANRTVAPGSARRGDRGSGRGAAFQRGAQIF